MIVQVFGSLGMGAGPSVGVLLAEEVTGTEVLAGIGRTSTTIGAAIFGILLAAIAIRAGRRTSLMIGLGTATFGAVVLIAASIYISPALMISGMLLFGAANAVMLQTRFAATDLATPERSGRALSKVVWLGTVGSVLGPNLGTPGRIVSDVLGMPPLAGAFVISAVVLILTALIVFVLLRPDPLTEAARLSGASALSNHRPVRAERRRSIVVIWSIRAARMGFVTAVVSHLMMVALMTMTPVHMNHQGASLELIGLTISIHVLGMYAFAPLVGVLVDRIGPRAAATTGMCVFVAAGLTATTLGTHPVLVEIPLFLLGIAWSIGSITGSTEVSNSVPVWSRVSVQGFTDASMNIVAAVAALLAGPLLGVVGFAGLGMIVTGVAIAVLVFIQLTPSKLRSETS